MAITQTNFKSDLSKVVSKDELRPALTVVKFQNGFAYATDSHCLVKQSLKWMDFTDEDIALLEGKALDIKAFKFVRKAKVIEVCEKHISVFIDGTKYNVEYSIHSTLKYPEADAVIPLKETVSVEMMSITKTNLINLLSAMSFETNPIFEFHGAIHAVVVYDRIIGRENQIGIVMPCMINN
jgi:hypothetical protein